MLLGLHTYSFHLHGIGQSWGGFKLKWKPVWDIYGLMKEAYQVIKSNPAMQRLNLEMEFDPGACNEEEDRKREYAAVKEGLWFSQEVLKVSLK
jgi:hypothetical protein